MPDTLNPTQRSYCMSRIRGKDTLEDRLNELASEITAAGEAKRRREESRKRSRSEIKRLRDEMLQRQAQLEAEVNSLYPILRGVRRAAKGEMC